jgi:crotonobetainyl-CoA:carnitine CoA-transferase CaiB-like acyl-CoA transferase
MNDSSLSHNTFFKDLLVVELASVLAGPSAGLFFVECGARVIKIENAQSNGDVTRNWLNSQETGEQISAYYASVNQGKELKMLDLEIASDINELEELLKQADIVISNFKTSSAKRWNLEVEQLHDRFPSLIIGQLDAFAEGDSRVAYDIVLQAETGYLSMTGFPDNPARLPVPMVDILAGHQLKEGILMALLHRYKTGNGSIVRVNLFETGIGALANQASNYLMSDLIPRAQGTLHPNIAPYGDCFLCADKKSLVLAIGSDIQFNKLLVCLNLPELIDDIRFCTNQNRLKNRTDLANILNSAFQKQERAVWLKLFEQQQIPCGAILNLEEVFQGKASHYIQESMIEKTHTRSVKTVNFRIEE